MSKRKDRRAFIRWEDATRRWAHDTARDLVMAMVTGHPVPATPYGVGAVLAPGEQVWAECPLRFMQERPWFGPTPGPPPIRPWLVTSERVVGRLGDGRLYGWSWNDVVGCRANLDPGAEVVCLDRFDGSSISWTGSGVAPLAVAATCRLFGAASLIDHPALARLRQTRTPEAVEDMVAR